ncbi:response regulator transcription factor [Parablautia sp. Marseille-Q6255]|uniref:response regulator transcription factor n=1 Tax=Parablautia sp. Marseille-Q6255 TaxID=3039593 RepID=UPI0024BD3F4C|nr:response regulator transcription factor [Parablautia sp. Marseille-Q6255]
MNEAQTRILAVDDNPEILEIIQILLTAEGYIVKTAASGDAALLQLHESSYDLIILDIMMPGRNGYQTCLEMRKYTNAPILFLSARTKDSDKTLGFSSGGDDYLSKPFSYSELLDRVHALLRRYQIYQGKSHMREGSALSQDAAYADTQETFPQPLSFHHLAIDETAGEVRAHGQRLILTDTEYAMLLLLVKNRPQIFSASRLYESVWKEPYYYGANNTVMVHIRNLRRKIEDDPQNPKLIKTIWGRGYYCD